MSSLLRPNAKDWTIKEQIIQDEVSELGLMFAKSDDGTMRLHILGGFEGGNRDFIFDEKGELSGAGTSLVDRGRLN
jgi:hypothetical protein